LSSARQKRRRIEFQQREPDALSEIKSFFQRSHKVIVALTVPEILAEHIVKKLA